MNNTPTLWKDYAPETTSLVTALLSAGFTILSGDNGEDTAKYLDGNLPAFVENLTACDDATLRVQSPDGKRVSLYLVFGNSPGELVCDYTRNNALETVLEMESDKWADCEQPMKPAPSSR